MKKTLLSLADKYPVVVITGPRQSGKTTLCKTTFPDKAYVNLEMPDIRQYAIDDPRSFLADYANGAILDEIQRAPELLSYIQGMVDEDDQAGRFILTGSQQFELMHSVTQTLAGRVGLLKLLPCSLSELQHHGIDANPDTQIFTGSYPRIYDTGLASYLLGMESTKHIHSNPLRGNLFENMVIVEALKFRLNRGKRSNLSFYRDSGGHEVDLLLTSGSDIFPIEIKSGATVNRDYFKGLNFFPNLNTYLPPMAP